MERGLASGDSLGEGFAPALEVCAVGWEGFLVILVIAKVGIGTASRCWDDYSLCS